MFLNDSLYYLVASLLELLNSSCWIMEGKTEKRNQEFLGFVIFSIMQIDVGHSYNRDTEILY